MPSPEWWVERGLGETRSALVADGEILAARIELDGIVRAGTRLEARLVRTGRPALASADGEDYLLPDGAPGISEGASLSVEVTRERIPGTEPWKRPLARLAPELPAEPAPSPRPLTFPGADKLGAVGWDDLLEEASSGIVRFPGGELRLHVTPAMTLIDVDGTLAPKPLALAAAAAAARSMARLDIGGSIGIDFPTVAGKADRQQIGETLDAHLPAPFERTALNGFGFLQVVRPRRRASLLELAADRGGFEARALLRRAALEGTGPTTLHPSPAATRWLEARPELVAALGAQRGGTVTLAAPRQG